MSLVSVDSVTMLGTNLIFCVAFTIALAGFANAQKAESIYSSLAEKDCKRLPERIGDDVVYAAECKGVGGFKILHLASDHTSIIDLMDNSGQTFELGIRAALGTAAPSMLGEKVEWRVKRSEGRVEPYALIARANVFDDPDDSSKRRSYLVVAKIATDSICVTDIVAPKVKGQNDEARRLADSAAAKKCDER